MFAYTGCDWAVEPTFVDLGRGAARRDGPQTCSSPLSTHLQIFPNAGEAIVQQIKHNMRGHGTYLLGEWHDRATPDVLPAGADDEGAGAGARCSCC